MFRCVVVGYEKGDEMAFVQFMECLALPDAADDAVGLACLRRADTKVGGSGSDVDRSEEANNRTAVGDWFVLIASESFLTTFHVVWASVGAHPSTAELPWSRPRFYISRFYSKLGMRTKRVLDQEKVY